MSLHWLAQSARRVPRDAGWLSPGERETLSTLRFPRRRSGWRLGRWTAKRAVCAQLGLSETELCHVEIRNDPLGAPAAFLRGGVVPCRLSLSHREGAALCAVTPPGHEPGCDLEWIETRSAAFLEDYLTAAERDGVLAAAPGRQALLATLLWSAKESALKALGVGLRRDTREVEVRWEDGAGAWHGLEVAHRDGRLPGWWRRCGGFLVTFVDRWPVPPPMPLEHGNAEELLRSSLDRLGWPGVPAN